MVCALYRPTAWRYPRNPSPFSIHQYQRYPATRPYLDTLSHASHAWHLPKLDTTVIPCTPFVDLAPKLSLASFPSQVMLWRFSLNYLALTLPTSGHRNLPTGTHILFLALTLVQPRSCWPAHPGPIIPVAIFLILWHPLRISHPVLPLIWSCTWLHSLTSSIGLGGDKLQSYLIGNPGKVPFLFFGVWVSEWSSSRSNNGSWLLYPGPSRSPNNPVPGTSCVTLAVKGFYPLRCFFVLA